VTTWLIDKSALVRLGASPDAAGWAARIDLTVLHMDKEFQIIADITGQPLEQLRMP
jgi:hypothetical protein